MPNEALAHQPPSSLRRQTNADDYRAGRQTIGVGKFIEVLKANRQSSVLKQRSRQISVPGIRKDHDNTLPFVPVSSRNLHSRGKSGS